ncbi:TPA: YadA-like family protein [Escherichia coli]|nr:YadA-like family protein [Escherichia coli]
MSKHFTKTLLAGVVLSVLCAGSALSQQQYSDSILKFSLYQNEHDSQQSADYLSSAKYQILWNKDKGYGLISYGSSPDVRGNENKPLYIFDSKGNVYTTLNDGSQLKVFNKNVADFARSVADGQYSTVKDVHNMNELEVRQLTQQIDSIKTTFADVSAGVNARIADVDSAVKNNVEKIGKIDSVLKSDESKGSLSVGGSEAIAVGQNSTAVGEGSYSRLDNATAVGAYSQAYKKNSSAFGVASKAHGQNSVAVGYGSNVDLNAANGVAVGAGASATHKNSVALGTQSVTTRDNEVYIGYKNSQGYGTRVLGGLSDGKYDTDAATVGQLNRNITKVYEDVEGAFTAADIKSRAYTDQKTSEVNEVVTEVDRRVTGNTQAVQKNSRAIASNTRTLQQHSARLDSQHRQIRENHEEMKRAAAQSAALAGLFQPYSVGKFNATAAVGGYSDQQALAVGVGYRFNEQTAAKAGAAFSDGDASWNVGVNFEF